MALLASLGLNVQGLMGDQDLPGDWLDTSAPCECGDLQEEDLQEGDPGFMGPDGEVMLGQDDQEAPQEAPEEPATDEETGASGGEE